jgi:NADH:ubiquinone oxidoreductase subunit B-like Fe-S oxidoreductase
MKHHSNANAETGFDSKFITKTTETKFPGLIIDDMQSWKQHLEQVINKMCVACCAIRNIQSLASQDTLRFIYFAQQHSIFSYGIILGGQFHQQK